MAAESSGGWEAREMPEAITLILVVWNVAFVPEYYWFPFPLVGWVSG
jgi:hypothetical protein